jgi:addiction module HigA family antidote
LNSKTIRQLPLTLIDHGEFIKRVYLRPCHIGSNELARNLKVSDGLVSRLINRKTDVSPAMALKLSKVLGRSPESWLQMQDNFNLHQASWEYFGRSLRAGLFVPMKQTAE